MTETKSSAEVVHRRVGGVHASASSPQRQKGTRMILSFLHLNEKIVFGTTNREVTKAVMIGACHLEVKSYRIGRDE